MTWFAVVGIVDRCRRPRIGSPDHLLTWESCQLGWPLKIYASRFPFKLAPVSLPSPALLTCTHGASLPSLAGTYRSIDIDIHCLPPGFFYELFPPSFLTLLPL